MTKRDRLMLIGIASFALLAAFWFLLITPQRKATAAAETQLTTAQSALQSAQQKVDAGREAQVAFRRDRDTILKLGRVVPETDDIPTLLTQLSALARREKVEFTKLEVVVAGSTAGSGATTESSGAAASGSTTTQPGVEVTSTSATAPLYSPGSVEIAGGLARTPIAVELKGTYFELERYLRAVQRFAVLSAKRTTADGRLVVVDGFSYELGDVVVEEGGKPKRSPDLTAKLAASVYYAPPIDAPSASSATTAGGTAPTPASSTGAAPTTSTGAAVAGGVR